jgi:hypothetical protein
MPAKKKGVSVAAVRRIAKSEAKKAVKAQSGGKITLRGINNFLRKHKILSKGAAALSSLGVPYVGAAGTVAGKFGYGRRRGGALRLAGSSRGAGMMLAGR